MQKNIASKKYFTNFAVYMKKNAIFACCEIFCAVVKFFTKTQV